MEYSKFGFDNFKDCSDVKVIVGRVVGDQPGSAEDVPKDFVFECIGFWLLH